MSRMDASALQSLKSHYISKVKALEGPSVLISSILKAIVDSRVIDETIALHGLSPVLPIDLDAGRLLDSSHLSMALHAFFAAKLQNIELDMLKEPPRTLDVVGDFHCAAFSVDITAFFNPPPPRFFSTKVRAVFKRYMISLGKRIFFQVLNAFILVKAGRSGNIVLYGTLYNVQPKMSSIATAFQLVKRSIAGNFVSIEYLAFSISLARCSHLMSLSLRGALEQGFIKMLSAKFPQLGADIADLSKYLASTIPISNLEGRPENFNIALTYAK
ncbi:MAG: hypothetical protein NTV34_17645, partial [Proteobacteria bacterium]|nr:hypothetical protein [Pseudomonadota bacterium]